MAVFHMMLHMSAVQYYWFLSFIFLFLRFQFEISNHKISGPHIAGELKILSVSNFTSAFIRINEYVLKLL